MNDDPLNADERPLGEELVSDAIWSRIVEYNEALAAGRKLDLHDDDAVRQLSPQSQAEVFDVLECLDLLARARRQKPTAAAANGTSDPLPPRLTIGRFEVLHEIGSGGHGVVFCANDPVLRRDIALKVPRPEYLFSPGMRRRFVAEAQAAAALDHANIVRVLEAGLDGTVCYIAQELCTGPSLAELLRERPAELTPRIAAQLARDLARGLAHAHQHGVLHRDLKPANVLLKLRNGNTGETGHGEPRHDEAPRGKSAQTEQGHGEPADSFPYIPKLCDFGICKAFDEDDKRTVTRTGTVIGTAAYMAPEQATGRASQIGPRSDVYGLGALLYEMLTGRPPSEGESQADVLRRVVSDVPPPIRRTRPEVPAKLEAICLKCLEKKPEHRYASADDLAADLQRFLDGGTVEARPPGWLRRLGRKVGSERRAIGFLLAAGVAGWLISLAMVWLYFRVLTVPADIDARLAVDREGAYLSDIRGAYNLWRENAERLRDNPNAGEEMAGILARDIPLHGAPDRRGFEWRYLWRLCHPAKAIGLLPKLASLHGHTTDAYFVTFSHDGSRIASGSRDRTARVWDAVTGRPICVCTGHTNDVNWVDFSPDAKLLATASEDQTVRIWDAATGKELFTLKGHESEVIGVLFNQAGDKLVSGDGRGVLKLWDLATRRQIKSVAAHAKRIQSLSWAADGRLLATAGDDEQVRLWTMPELVLRGEQHVSAAHATAFSRDDEMLAGAGLGTITVYDVRTGGRRTAFSRHQGQVESIRFSPDGQLLASCAGDGTLRFWEFASRKGWTAAPERELPGPPGEHGYVGLWCVAYSIDGSRLATSARDGVIEVYDASVTPQWTFVDKNRAVHAARAFAFSPQGDRLAIAHASIEPSQRGFQIWDVSPPHPVLLRDIRDVPIVGLCFSRDGKQLVLGCEQKIEIRDADSGERQLEIPLPPQADAPQVGFDSTGMLIAAITLDKSEKRTIHVYDPKTGRAAADRDAAFSAHEAAKCCNIAISPAGDLLAAADLGKAPQVSLYELPSGRLRSRSIGRRGETGHLSFAPHEPLLALNARGAVELWNTSTAREETAVPGMPRETGPLSFSADGRLLFVVTHELGGVEMWDVGRRKKLYNLPLPVDLTSQLRSWLLAVSPDGHHIVCSANDSHGNGAVYLFTDLPALPIAEQPASAAAVERPGPVEEN